MSSMIGKRFKLKRNLVIVDETETAVYAQHEGIESRNLMIPKRVLRQRYEEVTEADESTTETKTKKGEK